MDFFSNTPGMELSAIHQIFAIVSTIVIISVIFLYKDKIRNSKYEKFIRISFIVFLLALEAGFKIWTFYYNGFEIFELINLDLCYMTLLLSSIMMLTKSETLYKYIWFWMGGPLISLLIPDMGVYTFGPDRFRYYHFFMVHAGSIISFSYMYSVFGYRTYFKDFLKSAALLFGVAMIAIMMNNIFDLNYMFLSYPPTSSTPLDIVKDSPYLIYVAFTISFAFSYMFLVFYLPFYLYRKLKSH